MHCCRDAGAQLRTLGVAGTPAGQRDRGREMQDKRGSRIGSARRALLAAGHGPEDNRGAGAQHWTADARIWLDPDSQSPQQLGEGDRLGLGQIAVIRRGPEGAELPAVHDGLAVLPQPLVDPGHQAEHLAVVVIN